MTNRITIAFVALLCAFLASCSFGPERRDVDLATQTAQQLDTLFQAHSTGNQAVVMAGNPTPEVARAYMQEVEADRRAWERLYVAHLQHLASLGMIDPEVIHRRTLEMAGAISDLTKRGKP